MNRYQERIENAIKALQIENTIKALQIELEVLKNNPFGELKEGDRFYNRVLKANYIITEPVINQYVLINLGNGRRFTELKSSMKDVFGDSVEDFDKHIKSIFP